MYELEVTASFEAAHRLPEYNGKCRHIHGHHWIVTSQYTMAGKLMVNGIVADLVDLKRILRAICSVYDHQSLNAIMTCTPTAENISRVIFERLQDAVHGDFLSRVTVEETPGCSISYFKKPKPSKTLTLEELQEQLSALGKEKLTEASSES